MFVMIQDQAFVFKWLKSCQEYPPMQEHGVKELKPPVVPNRRKGHD
jgi:hypothetical protein